MAELRAMTHYKHIWDENMLSMIFDILEEKKSYTTVNSEIVAMF